MGFNGHISSRIEGNASSWMNGMPRRAGLRNYGREEPLAERTRIAQELHDTLLQGFFAAQMQLQLAVGELPPDSPAKPRFSGLIHLMSRAIEQGRLAIQGLRSPQEHVPSLGQAIAAVPNELGLEPAIQFRVVVEGTERQLNPSLSSEVYRVVREAIVNAYRHSGATDIEAQIEYRPGEFRASVRDNGCGIDPQNLQWTQNGHWGLRGMRERAERIGARLRVLSRTALGTEVELRIPGSVAFEQCNPCA
jgi:signal transduction histidine kinase